MKLACHHCGTELRLLREGVPNYAWECPNRCLPAVDTGVPATEQIASFDRAASQGIHRIYPECLSPIDRSSIPGAKVYMPHLLLHFIECRRGGCYNRIYLHCLVPHLDSPQVVDYVLRSSVIYDSPDCITGTTGAKIYSELLRQLRAVKSSVTHKYLRDTVDRTQEPDHAHLIERSEQHFQ